MVNVKIAWQNYLGHYLNQCWFIANWTNKQASLKFQSKHHTFLDENVLEMPAEWHIFVM